MTGMNLYPIESGHLGHMCGLSETVLEIDYLRSGQCPWKLASAAGY